MFLNKLNSIKPILKKLISFKVYGNIRLYDYLYVIYMKFFYRRKGVKFDVHITEHCNLNCKSCSHFSPLAQKEFANVESFEKDIKRMSELFHKKIYKICLLGGEPLLHPQILDFIHIAYKYSPKAQRELVTNGLLLLKQTDEFWKTCQQTNTIINVTNYPVDIKIEEIKKKAKSENVKLIIELNIKEFKKPDYDFNGEQNIKKNYKYCSSAIHCTQLNDGKLTPCPQVAYIRHLNSYFGLNLEVSEKDYMNIHTAKSKTEILKFLRHPIPFCRYCNLKTMDSVNEWGISKKELKEWKTM